ncbi:hypothetical protein, partial [Flavihumibacter cheonanensis]|uniref:hypothetical protein n=1 Tax=Flavihumibacter cheonanensis TaxID=1442385 RepID=UPI001EF98756
ETHESRGFYVDVTGQTGGLKAHVDYWRARQGVLGWSSPEEPDMVADPTEVLTASLDYQRALGSFKLGATLSYQRPRMRSWGFGLEGPDGEWG